MIMDTQLVDADYRDPFLGQLEDGRIPQNGVPVTCECRRDYKPKFYIK